MIAMSKFTVRMDGVRDISGEAKLIGKSTLTLGWLGYMMYTSTNVITL